ncbi:MAG TPA: ribbon-helix-helix protein, CopG family [Solirubrobacteraceae bacterium]|jgi:metal-responsive CopG/Arc/MetJ family transcriptional regulator|nr:ribbon-helix-helix protein, CopG family [Solirubrobacteraceae bacterium]
MSKTHRVNVNFSETAYRTLEDLAERKGKSMSEVLRDAVTLEKWFQDANDQGGKVLIEQDGQSREIIPR